MAFSMSLPWSEGEEKMHNLLHVPPQDNPTSAMLTPQASFMLQRAPLLAIGTLDSDSRPWTALWGGAPGFSEPLGGGFVGTRTLVDGKFDPVVQTLVGGKEKGETLQPEGGEGKMLSGLAIDLVTRKRVKIAGKMAAGTLRDVDVEIEGDSAAEPPSDIPKTQSQIQLVTKIEQSLGNCPKYLNQYELKPALVTASILSEGPALSKEGRALIDKADMLFLSTSRATDMDTNHRGGPPGFVRTISPTCIIYPEYSGNRLYQSLGNLQLNPRIGITVPDYETGDVLYTTGEAEILIGSAAAQLLPGTNLAIKIHLTSTRLVQHGLPFRGTLQLNGHSPYNPRVRPLATEGNIKTLSPSSAQTARLVKKTLLAPDIARFTFSVPGGVTYAPGQWAALSFREELDEGYSHMRNDDPRSLNDDFVRTFTISSVPQYRPEDKGSKEEGFEMTIRRVGKVTGFLFKQSERSGLEIPLLGVGGEFRIEQGGGAGEKIRFTPFIAAGVGITPLLGQIKTLILKPAAFRLFWTVRQDSLGLVADTLAAHPDVAPLTDLFVTGGGADSKDEEVKKELEQLSNKGVTIQHRRVAKGNLESVDAQRWYLCAGGPLRKQVLSWLPGREVLFEDFDY
jgi:ferredoxin-NADP reductase/predicted pyridoxine 5'-phosphate oxidase superfamily flavin-nucleotide-binding protein